MESLFNHKSIRKYKNKDIESKLLDKVLEAGMRASNTGNMQLYSVIVTKDEQNKQMMAPLHFNQGMATQAPIVLTICADVNRFNNWCKLRNADAGYNNLLWFVNATIDAMLFAQNICIAAESEGLGICYLGTTLYNAKEFIETLKLPEGVVPLTAITMGYPDEDPALVDRLPLEAILHHETYRENTSFTIEKYYREKELLEISQKFVEENGKQNLAQVFTDVRYKKADNIFFSEKLVKTLKDQGFDL
ncbi:nitroreductase family protein [Sunxiuqinia sp. A32]|uniref:nitroreductase family protein n=1 Tax=Sunxiuqinia sp. A32 TaxID=3461496 RepID=UPI0040453814